MPHAEKHRIHRTGWLRAAVMGANDGVISTASLLMGIATSNASHGSILVSGVAALVAGAGAMAAGEYVSVSSQSDTEKADLHLETVGLQTQLDEEHRELASIYIERGLDADLAQEVARQLMAKDALAAHARDELGITDTLGARPLQAAVTSAASFVTGAIVPVGVATLAPMSSVTYWIGGVSLSCLVFLGGLAANVGGASMITGARRVLFWGALAMGITAGVGKLFAVYL